MREYQECSHEGGYRWLDCDDCEKAQVPCQMSICIDCGADEPGYEDVICPTPA